MTQQRLVAYHFRTARFYFGTAVLSTILWRWLDDAVADRGPILLWAVTMWALVLYNLGRAWYVSKHPPPAPKPVVRCPTCGRVIS